MEILATIIGLLVIILAAVIGVIIISFFLEVPTCLRGILSALREHNEIEKEKLEIMKNNKGDNL